MYAQKTNKNPQIIRDWIARKKSLRPGRDFQTKCFELFSSRDGIGHRTGISTSGLRVVNANAVNNR